MHQICLNQNDNIRAHHKERDVIMNFSPQNNKLIILKNQHDSSRYYPYYGFSNCENLDSIEVEYGHPHLYSMNNCLIRKNELELILGCKNSEVPHFITKINYPAFYKCKGIKELSLPLSVETIGRSAFSGSDIKSIGFAENITTIQECAFENCRSLSTVTFSPSSPFLEKIGDGAFRNCSSLVEINLPNNIKKIGRRAFGGCQNLEKFYLPEQLIKISNSMFEKCKKLKQMYIPDNVEIVSSGAFQDCSSLEYIKLPKNDDKIREDVFKGCTNLKYVEIPYGVKEIRSGAFRGCDSLQTIYIPSSVNKIAWDAFNYIKYSTNTNYSLTIRSAEGSYAERYAKRNGYDFVSVTEENAFPLVCPDCDTEIVKNAKYCHNCGRKIRDV